MTTDRPDVGKLLREAKALSTVNAANDWLSQLATTGVTYGSPIAGSQSYNANALVVR